MDEDNSDDEIPVLEESLTRSPAVSYETVDIDPFFGPCDCSASSTEEGLEEQPCCSSQPADTFSTPPTEKRQKFQWITKSMEKPIFRPGRPICRQAQLLICRCTRYCAKEADHFKQESEKQELKNAKSFENCLLYPLANTYKRASKILGLGVKTIKRVEDRAKEAAKFETPLKSKAGPQEKFAKVDNFMCEQIRRVMHREFRHERHVTLSTTLDMVKDETWLNQNYTTAKAWYDTTVEKDPRLAKEPGMSLGYRDRPGRGQRLVICHIGSEDGFLKDALLVFTSKKTGDYHEEMDSPRFEDWFEKVVLPKIPPNSAIVMDNAPYHSRMREKPPTKSSTKQEMMDWLRKHNIKYSDNMTRPDLYETKIRPIRNQDKYRVYAVDQMAAEKGVEVIRLPPYHCIFNPIEFTWSTVKRRSGKRNQNQKIKELEMILREEIAKVTAEEWQKCIKHTDSIVDEYIRREEPLLGKAVAPLVIDNLDDDDDDDDLDVTFVLPDSDDREMLANSPDEFSVAQMLLNTCNSYSFEY